MFRIEISNGELRFPWYLLIPASILMILSYVFAIGSVLYESTEERLCRIPTRNSDPSWAYDPGTMKSTTDVDTNSKILPGCSFSSQTTNWNERIFCSLRRMHRNYSTDRVYSVPQHLHLVPRGPKGFFKPRPNRRHNITTAALITPTAICVGSCPHLVILILSPAHDRKTRDDTRRTWASVAKTRRWPSNGSELYLNGQVEIIFVLTWGEDNKLWDMEESDKHILIQKLTIESQTHNDVLFLGIKDKHRNLTATVVTALAWAVHHCRNTSFFLKMIQDIFLNVPLLLDLLIKNQQRMTNSVFGHVQASLRQVDRVGHWKLGYDQYPMVDYPLHAEGGAYVMSREAAIKIITLYSFFPLIAPESVLLTGIIAKITGVRLFALPQWAQSDSNPGEKHWCKLEQLVTSGVASSVERHQLWASVIYRNEWPCAGEVIKKIENQACWAEFGAHSRLWQVKIDFG